jgi:hypothetical protein
MELSYNVKTEVTKNQFKELKRNASGICAFQEQEGKYFIKLLFTKYKSYVQRIIDMN